MFLCFSQRSQRVPPSPSWYPFAWIVEISRVSEDDMLRMVGLDAYMLMRYLNICCRTSAFLMFWGLIIVVPLYATGSQGCYNWNQLTLANIPNPSKDPVGSRRLWVPVVFAYLFSAYFCGLMGQEYRNFLHKRIEYLVRGDTDTPPQTYYTLMLERIPSTLQTESDLRAFFEKIFPGRDK